MKTVKTGLHKQGLTGTEASISYSIILEQDAHNIENYAFRNKPIGNVIKCQY